MTFKELFVFLKSASVTTIVDNPQSVYFQPIPGEQNIKSLSGEDLLKAITKAEIRLFAKFYPALKEWFIGYIIDLGILAMIADDFDQFIVLVSFFLIT